MKGVGSDCCGCGFNAWVLVFLLGVCVWGWILKCGSVRGLVASPLPGTPRKGLSSLAKFGLFNAYAHAAAHTFGEFHAWKSGDNLVCLSFFYGFTQQGL